MTAADHPQAPDRRRWLALAVVLTAGFMDLLDVTIVNVALPSIQRDLGAGYAELEWIVAAYVLGFAATLITGGRLGDIAGRKRMFLVGVAGFTVASALCGLATGPATLVAARFLQGAVAGLMVPQILATIHVTFPPAERAKAFGLWGGVMGSASAAGLIFGGLLVEADLLGLGWRPIFLVNIPVGVAALVVAWFVVPESRSPAAPRLDLPGVVLAVTAVLMLVYPLTEGRRLGWPPWTFLVLAGGVALLAVFAGYERWRTRTAGSPLVDLELFRRRGFTAGMLAWLIFWIALGGFFLVWTLYLQVGLGWPALRAGLTAVSFALGAMAAAGLSVQVLTPRFGRRVLMAGALLNGAGFGAYAWVIAGRGPDVEPWHMIAPLVVAGVGFGLIVAPMIDLVLTGVPVRAAGSASGLLNTTTQVGMAFGVALAGVLYFGQIDDHSGHGVAEVTPALQDELAAAGVPAAERDGIVAGLAACVRDWSAAVDPTEPPASCRSDAAAGPDEVRDVVARAAERANAYNAARAFGVTLWCAAGILAVVLAALFALPRRVRPRDLGAELAADVAGPPVRTGRAPGDRP
ncbi:MFS transporter [Jiangella anatolica]|uniref:MFS transporter n=1 Tax=Jiangella anatolica TaxID=2670374 RepID=A0A2W2B2N5_9ACTN|nr:MFS transporter [Jiangella anatolica]PZF80272.1 MFS transporter [Jiangella anatolica]